MIVYLVLIFQTMAQEQIKYIFVYGSLKPNGDSSMPWTKTGNEGKINFKAIVYDHSMYFNRFPAVKTNRSGKQVVRYIMAIDPFRNASWNNKPQHFDDIKGTS